MHRNRLQELCQKRMWALPVYTSNSDGPDHNPRFRASVAVNGDVYDAPSLSKSVKEAHNKAAEVALDRLSAVAAGGPAPPVANASSPPRSATSGYSQLVILESKVCELFNPSTCLILNKWLTKLLQDYERMDCGSPGCLECYVHSFEDCGSALIITERSRVGWVSGFPY